MEVSVFGDVPGSAVGSTQIDPSTLAKGQQFRLTVVGFIDPNAQQAGTVTAKLYFREGMNNTLVGASIDLNVIADVSEEVAVFQLTALVAVRSDPAAAATIYSGGLFLLAQRGNEVTAPFGPGSGNCNTANATTIDLTFKVTNCDATIQAILLERIVTT